MEIPEKVLKLLKLAKEAGFNIDIASLKDKEENKDEDEDEDEVCKDCGGSLCKYENESEDQIFNISSFFAKKFGITTEQYVALLDCGAALVYNHLLRCPYDKRELKEAKEHHLSRATKVYNKLKNK